MSNDCVMIWVKEAGDEGSAFKVAVSSTADVDDLKDAIKKKAELNCAAFKLQIKENENGQAHKVGKKISDITSDNNDENPIYFCQPEQQRVPGIYIILLLSPVYYIYYIIAVVVLTLFYVIDLL